MTKLDEVVVALLGERLGPGSFVDEALGTAAVEGFVYACNIFSHNIAEALAPAAFGVDGRVADEDNFDRAALEDLHGFYACGGKGSRLGTDVGFQRGNRSAEVYGDDAAEGVASFPVEVRLVGEGFAVGILFGDSEGSAFGFADPVEVVDAVGLQVDERDLH